MKKIVLMPTKNDDWILEKTLPCILLWADFVIIADQNSSDRTLEICKQSPKVKVIQNNNAFHSTKVRQMLLDEARRIEGKKIIFSIDSDEVLTADVLLPEFWQKMEKYPVGTSFEFQWVQLWRSTDKYRNDDSVWSKSYKQFAFMDDRKAMYTYEYGVNDHNSRVPTSLVKNSVRLEMPKVLHFQFVNWERMLSKQRFYRVQDFVQTTKKIIDAIRVNKMYYIAKDEAELRLDSVSKEWTQAYQEQGIDLKSVKDEGLFWYDIEVLKWFKQFDANSFLWLDIWDIDWEQKRMLTLEKSREFSLMQIYDPRGWFVKLYHQKQNGLMDIFRLISKILKKLL